MRALSSSARLADQQGRAAIAFEQRAEVRADQRAQTLLRVGDAVDGLQELRMAGIQALDHRRLNSSRLLRKW